LCDMTVEAYCGAALMNVDDEKDEKDEHGQTITFDLMTVDEAAYANWLADGKPVCSECGMRHPPPHDRVKMAAYFQKKDEEHAQKQRNIATAQAMFDANKARSRPPPAQKRQRTQEEKDAASLRYARGQRLFAEAVIAKLAENEKAARESVQTATSIARSIETQHYSHHLLNRRQDEDNEDEAAAPKKAPERKFHVRRQS